MKQGKLDLNDLKALLGIIKWELIHTGEIFIEKKTNINGNERIFLTGREKIDTVIMVTAMLPYEGKEYERCLEKGTKLYDEYVAKDQSCRESDIIHPIIELFKSFSDVDIE